MSAHHTQAGEAQATAALYVPLLSLSPVPLPLRPQTATASSTATAARPLRGPRSVAIGRVRPRVAASVSSALPVTLRVDRSSSSSDSLYRRTPHPPHRLTSGHHRTPNSRSTHSHSLTHSHTPSHLHCTFALPLPVGVTPLAIELSDWTVRFWVRLCRVRMLFPVRLPACLLVVCLVRLRNAHRRRPPLPSVAWAVERSNICLLSRRLRHSATPPLRHSASSPIHLHCCACLAARIASHRFAFPFPFTCSRGVASLRLRATALRLRVAGPSAVSVSLSVFFRFSRFPFLSISYANALLSRVCVVYDHTIFHTRNTPQRCRLRRSATLPLNSTTASAVCGVCADPALRFASSNEQTQSRCAVVSPESQSYFAGISATAHRPAAHAIARMN